MNKQKIYFQVRSQMQVPKFVLLIVRGFALTFNQPLKNNNCWILKTKRYFIHGKKAPYVGNK